MVKDTAVMIMEECLPSDRTFTWSDVGYSVADKTKKKEMKTLIQGMFGQVKAGEVVAIMGGSGKVIVRSSLVQISLFSAMLDNAISKLS